MKTTKKWIDENGLEIPANRVTAIEKLKERTADRLVKKALDINARLLTLKDDMTASAEQIFSAVLADNGIDSNKEHKGNFSYFNFDRTIKIEQDVQERIEFDDALILIAKAHFDTFLQNNSAGIDEMIRSLITDAFNTSKGKLDTKKVLSLVKHRSRIPQKKYPDFHLAIDAIEKSISRPSSKKYHRISCKNTAGEFEVIQLNFSAV